MFALWKRIVRYWEVFRIVLQYGPEGILRDSLTKLYTRLILDAVWKREVAAAKRHGRALSIVLLDVDNLKTVNDAFGHSAGDKLLQKVAGIIISHCRASDIPLRWGGDEFLVLLPETNREGAHHFGNRIMAGAFLANIGVSFGASSVSFEPSSSFQQEEDDPALFQRLVEKADEEMYRHKHTKA